MLKGKLIKGTYNEWLVVETTFGPGDVYETYHQLHPDDVEEILELANVFDNIDARINAYPEVEFRVVEHQKMDGIAKYAKIVHTDKE